MFKKMSIAALGLLMALSFPQNAKAETIFERVSRTGVLTFGTRVDTIPYSYVNDKQQVVGYSVDVMELIRQELERKLNRPITVEFKVINNSDELMQKVSKGEIDIACTTQFTWQREDFVDFSMAYSLSGIRLLIKNNSGLTGTPESLSGKRVGVVPNSMGEVVMKFIQPKAVLVPLKEAEEGFVALRDGKVDAIAADSIILAGATLKGNPEAYALVPVQPLARYGVACMVPQNNSMLLNSVNRAIAKLMQGYIIGEQKYMDIVNRWLGTDGLVEVPPELIRAYFETIILSREQIPLTDTPQTQRR
ncbi:amino acid ABC transporter substrate-binding protein [[Phormidium ambiguum] IAM M-71]|uniref:Amino acid ABC transporter substrate-binding protein n=1 Tax=[Phormidium ambiguum] IAM M-71 TaxID=454136 RepID=A0A1U7IQX3_9CYAN|nr:extracellular substrate binding-like orphan protein GrrP [Phormidium ambiguum]OKH39810.1 amino acid ABC transporter substrate-binding protein [Phormidium ambiguum IAM M-71]